MKILVWEDDPLFSKLLTYWFKGIAAEVIVAESWQDIEVNLEGTTILWLDLNLPGSPPGKTLRRITAIRQEHRNLVMVVMSGYIDPVIKAAAETAGVDAIMAKSGAVGQRQALSLILLGILGSQTKTEPMSENSFSILEKTQIKITREEQADVAILEKAVELLCATLFLPKGIPEKG